MQKAYRLALRAKGQTSPNPMVGSVIVKGRRIIGEGWHRRCGFDHAEVDALKKARGSVSGARMYVTLEPCYHYGRTPPCVDQLITSGIREVFIGMKDPNPRTNGRSIAKLRRAGIKTRVGFLRDELEAMNEAFIKYTKKRMPFIVAKSAQSLDGKIALANGESQWITSEAARRFAKNMRDEFDAILVGINTVLKDNPRLNGNRKNKKLKKVILDSTLKIPLRARLFSGVQPADCIIATTAKASDRKKAALCKLGVPVIVCPQRGGWVDLKWLFKELAKREITSILVEGGAHTIGSALRERLVDKMFIYIAPKIFGDQKALSSVVGIKAVHVGKAIQLKKAMYQNIGDDILVQGYMNYTQ
jgi:diaminohydroxyphosphoribosylaminopyrimidine deaminase/5-amino-6-(5-phosphoribosylamino)uracil reductase